MMIDETRVRGIMLEAHRRARRRRVKAVASYVLTAILGAVVALMVSG